MNGVSELPDSEQMEELQKVLPNQYRLIAKISQGGMGTIYKGLNRFTGAEFAIKVLLPKYAQDAQALQRFTLEAKAASTLKHPHICHCNDFGVSDGKFPYLVMDWVEGISLQKRIDRHGPLSVEESCHIFMQVSQALDYAHQSKLVHRDLKPDNIMLCRVGVDRRTEVQVVDFGIAKVLTDGNKANRKEELTMNGAVLGTPLFMSPEQASGKEVDGRSDIYSLGCVMYFTLSGSPPFSGNSAMDIINKHLNERPAEITTKSIPDALKTIIFRCLEKLPDDRYPTMAQVVKELERIHNGTISPKQNKQSEQQNFRTIFSWVLTFILGFGITYALSIALQSIPDDKQTIQTKSSSSLNLHHTKPSQSSSKQTDSNR